MRRFRIGLALSLLAFIPGCRTQQPTTSSPTPPPGVSVAELRVQFAALYAQYRKDCIEGDIHQIDTRKSLCETERRRMDPVGNALQAAEEAETARQLTSR